MLKFLANTLWFVVFAWQASSSAFADTWAERITEVRNEADAEVRKAVVANEHAKAKKLLHRRGKRLRAILSEFETAAEQDLGEADMIAILHAYELLWRWEQAEELAADYLVDHPDSETAWMARFRCLLNVGQVEEVARLLKEIEGRFPPHSPIQFVHSKLAPRYQQNENWPLVLRHSEIAARRRIAVLRTHPEVARWALFDFRRIAEVAIAMDAKDVGSKRLNKLAQTLDEILVKLRDEQPSDDVFVQQCLARQLRSDIAYWLGADEVAVSFREWVNLIVRGWKSDAISNRVARRQSYTLVQYLQRHGATLTEKMMDALDYLKAFVDERRSNSPDNASLARLSTRIQNAIDGEAFRPKRKREAFGGIGP